MFDIGFSELVLVFVIGLIVLGPERLPVAVKTVAGWIRAVRSLAANVQHELAQELKLQELQDSLKKVEEAGRGTLSPELRESMEELRKTADSMKRSVQQSIDIEKAEDEAHGLSAAETVTPAKADTQASAPVTSVQATNAVSEASLSASHSVQQPVSAAAQTADVARESVTPAQAGAQASAPAQAAPLPAAASDAHASTPLTSSSASDKR